MAARSQGWGWWCGRGAGHEGMACVVRGSLLAPTRLKPASCRVPCMAEDEAGRRLRVPAAPDPASAASGVDADARRNTRARHAGEEGEIVSGALSRGSTALDAQHRYQAVVKDRFTCACHGPLCMCPAGGGAGRGGPAWPNSGWCFGAFFVWAGKPDTQHTTQTQSGREAPHTEAHARAFTVRFCSHHKSSLRCLPARPPTAERAQRPAGHAMNSEATALCREVASEIESHGGLAAFKAHSLKNLELRTVLRVRSPARGAGKARKGSTRHAAVREISSPGCQGTHKLVVVAVPATHRRKATARRSRS